MIFRISFLSSTTRKLENWTQTGLKSGKLDKNWNEKWKTGQKTGMKSGKLDKNWNEKWKTGQKLE